MGWKTKLLITIVLPILVGKILDPSHVVRTRDFVGKLLKKVLARFDALWEDETMLKAREINKVRRT